MILAPFAPCPPADKNANNLDEATERFKEITNAYTTLSDPNERCKDSRIFLSERKFHTGGTGAVKCNCFAGAFGATLHQASVWNRASR